MPPEKEPPSAAGDDLPPVLDVPPRVLLPPSDATRAVDATGKGTAECRWRRPTAGAGCSSAGATASYACVIIGGVLSMGCGAADLSNATAMAQERGLTLVNNRVMAHFSIWDVVASLLPVNEGRQSTWSLARGMPCAWQAARPSSVKNKFVSNPLLGEYRSLRRAVDVERDVFDRAGPGGAVVDFSAYFDAC
jgi:hypothetical protein